MAEDHAHVGRDLPPTPQQSIWSLTSLGSMASPRNVVVVSAGNCASLCHHFLQLVDDRGDRYPGKP